MWVKQVMVSILSIGFLWSIAPVTHYSTRLTSHPITTPHVIRFRVIANSDNPLDQAIKLDVRDAILRELEPVLEGAHSVTQARTTLTEQVTQIQAIANQVLARLHASYRARVSLGTTVFPTKAYGSWILPAGHYTALLVRLGHAQGHNWWCVLYPSLCFVDMGNAVAVPYQDTLATKSALPLTGVPASPVTPTSRLRVSWRTPRFVREFINWL